VTSLGLLSKYLLITELCFDMMLCSYLCRLYQMIMLGAFGPMPVVIKARAACAHSFTLAASNNRADPMRSLYYCLFAPHICGAVLCAHSIRSEPRIQRNASGEVATTTLFTTNCTNRTFFL